MTTPAGTYSAVNVVLAIGYYDNPNTLGIPGEDLPHVSHYYTEPYAFYNRDVVVVGGKNSAAEAALDLFRGGRAGIAGSSRTGNGFDAEVLGAAGH